MFNSIPIAAKSEGGYIVANKKATLNEYNVSLALDYFDLAFIFRVSFYGGQRTLGGIELDFLVYAPFPTPLAVHGNYFHQGQLGKRDKLRQAIIEAHFRRELLIIWGNESETELDARNAVRKVLRL